MADENYHKLLLVIGIVSLIASGFMARDLFTWGLEVSPAIIGLFILVFTYKKFRFSNLVYTLILMHAFILMYGGIYTYAETPFGFWMQEFFGWNRNNYDKIGHLAQGFVPAFIIRELFLRLNVINETRRRWLPWIVISIVLAGSAFYEFIEWWVALASGSAGDAFLGTQGYIWDTQSDMFLALLAAIFALIFFSRFHNNSIQKNKSVIV